MGSGLESNIIKDRISHIKIAAHRLASSNIVISVPGVYGDIDGYNNKYTTLADFIREKKIGAVVRTNGNEEVDGTSYEVALRGHVEAVIDYALENSETICGARNPDLLLMGFSAGASGIAAVARNYRQVRRILLIAPSGDAGKDAIEHNLGLFTGSVHIAVGERDEIVGAQAGKMFYDLAKKASERKLVTIPNCDHQFRGERNGYIMSKAPLWAFAGDTTFPSPEGGRKLY